ncbi:MAG: hypothetical protein ACRDQ5_01475 [Sciscionella sp.]
MTVAPPLVALPLAERLLALKGVSDVEDYYQGLPGGDHCPLLGEGPSLP